MVTLSKGGGGGDYEYITSRGGKLIRKIIPGDDFVTPEEGLFKKLELHAIGAQTFQSTGQFPKEKRAIVMRVLDEGHDNFKELVKTTVNYTHSAKGLGEKTYIGQIFTAILGEYPDGVDIDDPGDASDDDEFWNEILGGHFQAILTVSDDGQYVNFGKDSIKACKKPATSAPRARKPADRNELIDEDNVEDAA